jgi:FkbM family methyltransferase
MITFLKRLVSTLVVKLLNTFGWSLIKKEELSQFKSNAPLVDDFLFMLNYPSNLAPMFLEYRNKSSSQRKQDLFVLTELGYKKNGYFVEFGACDGLLLSNSLLLEKEFEWKGILAEPGKYWHEALFKNRHASIEKDCVWTTTGVDVEFNEVESPSLSTISNFNTVDHHLRSSGKTYSVKTISLLDLLIKHEAPFNIDYLSIDTEGSEFDILNSFDFSAYSISIITVEHNYSPMRAKIHNLLSSKGYNRVHQEFSKFDDWYILNKN